MIRLTKILPKEARFTLPERPSDRKKSTPESSRIQVENDEESKREISANIIQKMWKNRIIIKWWNLMKKLQIKQAKRFIKFTWLTIFVFATFQIILNRVTGFSGYALALSVTVWSILGIVCSRLLLLSDKDVRLYGYLFGFLFYHVLGFTIDAPYYIYLAFTKTTLSPHFIIAFCYNIFIGPLAGYGISRVVITFAKILKHYNKDNLQAVSHKITTRYISVLPLILFPLMQFYGNELTAQNRINELCEYMPGSTKVNNQQWKNCTEGIAEGAVMKYPQLDLHFPKTATTVLEVKLEELIISYVSKWNNQLPLMFQSFQPSLLAAFSICLGQVCRVSVRDVFTCRATILEIAVGFCTIVFYLYAIIASQMSMPSGLVTPSEYMILQNHLWFWAQIGLACPSLVGLALLMYYGLQVIQLESLPEKERDLSKYNFQVQMIHRRGVKLYNEKNNSPETLTEDDQMVVEAPQVVSLPLQTEDREKGVIVLILLQVL